MPSNNIAFARNYTSVIDEVYQRASVSGVLNSGRRMVRAGHNAKEILIGTVGKSAVSFNGMLTNPTHIQRMNNSAWAWAHFYCPGKLTVTGTCTPDLSRKAIACGRTCANAHYQSHATMPWHDVRSDLRGCEFLPYVGAAVVSIDYWFYGDSVLQDVSGWANVIGLQFMCQAFNGCTALALVYSRGLEPSTNKDYFYAFVGCTALASILMDNTWALASGASGMSTFYNCTSIAGGNGASYSSSATRYARIVVDRAGQAGYLTGV